MNQRTSFALIATLLSIVIFAGVNLVFSHLLSSARIDLTENKIYTLSDGATEVVERIVEPVRLELVYTREVGVDYPDIRAHATRARELLQKIASEGKGQVELTETNPEPFSTEEDRISLAGITPISAHDSDPLYFGVIGRNSVDDEIIIPFLNPDRDAYLEYDLVRLIAQLDDPTPPVVAVVSDLPGFTVNPSDPRAARILKEMRRTFQVKLVDPDFAVLPADTDILFLAHATNLNDWQHYIIDQFLLTKGRALIATDPTSMVLASANRPNWQSSLGPLSNTLQLTSKNSVAADSGLALPVEVPAPGGRTRTMGQPLFLAVSPDQMSNDDPATANLSRAINLGAAGFLNWTDTEEATFQPLLSTTGAAQTVQPSITLPRLNPMAITDQMSGEQTTKTLAARISGNLKTAFQGSPPQTVLPTDARAAQIAQTALNQLPNRAVSSALSAQIIVLADTDILIDDFYISPADGTMVADNATFILNALDSLVGGDALNALRSRTPTIRPMTRIENIRSNATQRLQIELAELQSSLEQQEAHLQSLETQRDEFQLAQSGADSTTTNQIEEAKQEVLRLRQRVRGVEQDFRKDIERVEAQLKFINIWLGAILITCVGLSVFFWRTRKQGRRRRS